MKLFLKIVVLILLVSDKSFSQQTYSFSGWAAGSTSYTKTISSPVSNTMSVTYSESANNRANTLITDNSTPCFGTNSLATGVPFYYNSTWPTTAWEDYSSLGCYCYSVTGFASGLALAANWTTNASTNYQQVIIQFTFPVCAPVNFTIWNINQGSNSATYPFTDNVDISALDNLSISVPAANIIIGNTCGNTVTTAGNTKTITGVQNNCNNCANDGSGSHSISIGAVVTYVKSITLKYYSSTTNTQADPTSQYIIVTDITTTCNSILPIELLSFSGNCNGNNKTLEWATASESNNDYFTIERSPDGKEWNEIGKIKGAGNSSTLHNYEFVDTELPAQYSTLTTQYYYRLKQTDYNGKYEYAGPISLELCSPDEWKFILQTVFSGEELQGSLVATEDADIWLSILDVQGRIIRKENFNAVRGSNLFKINISNLDNGLYFIKANNNKQNIIRKFVKL